MRRRTGLSQRALAECADVSLTTIGAVEAGRRPPSLTVLAAVLRVAGLELAVDLPPAELGARQIGYLRRSMVRRLHHALGGSGNPRDGRPFPRWRQLVQLAQVGEVALHGEAALGVWLPAQVPPTAVEVCVQPWPGCALPDVPDLCVVPACAAHVRAPVVIVFAPPWRVSVDPPADLALHPVHAAERAALRAVARVLHEQAARDEAGRRTRAHRDPDHEAERAHVFHTKRFGQRPMPDPTDTRSWRLDDEASLAEWLRRYGYPV